MCAQLREFSMGHVEGALNIPVEVHFPTNHATLTDKNQTIVVYCASGMRSGYARTMLMQMGYTNVINAGTPYETAQLTHKPLVR
jgi:phage shock protein E